MFASTVLVALALLSACAPIWVRRSTVQVTPQAFPLCVESVFKQLGLETRPSADSDGQPRVVADYLRVSLQATASNSTSSSGQVVNLVLIGMGHAPPPEVEAKMGSNLGTVASAIAISCGGG